MMLPARIFAVIVILALTTPVTCYNILFAFPFGGKSHKIALDPIAMELAKRGHHVTFMTVSETIPDSPGITNIILEGARKTAEAGRISFFEGKPTDTNYRVNFINRLKTLTDATYREPLIADLVRNPRDKQNNPKYDLLVVDAFFNEFTLPIAQSMGIPSAYVSPAGLLSPIAWSLNIPNPFSYIPAIGMSGEGGVPDMDFWGRLTNTVFSLGFVFYRQCYLWPVLDEVIHEHYPEALPLAVLERNVSLVLANSHFSFANQIPSMPYYHEVGGLNLYPAKKLPNDLEEFMQSSGEHGVIFFSLGSATKGESMPLEMQDKIIKAFARVPQKVLFKFETNATDFPKNVKLITWAPQQDILGHSKLRLFITHCGGMSTQEAAYHASPIIGIPLSADQHANAGNAVQKGFGAFLDWKTFTVDELVDLINTVINDKRYKNAATDISALMKDRPQPPVETAAYWLEYVIRHKGAPHLKSGAENLNFFQYFLLDVIGAIMLVLVAVLWLLAFVVRKALKLCGICFCPSDVSWKCHSKYDASKQKLITKKKK